MRKAIGAEGLGIPRHAGARGDQVGFISKSSSAMTEAVFSAAVLARPREGSRNR
jgi:hypothetical protein